MMWIKTIRIPISIIVWMDVIILPLHPLYSVKMECGAEQLGRNLGTWKA
jgi:hypothetical protein